MKGSWGKLRIGDEWNAIVLLARTQTSPLKAVAELVENAIDARARNVEVVRFRAEGAVHLTVADDGEGVPLGDDGLPDFKHVATHVCDSMKRHLDEAHRAGVHGEFGIGLLGFWSLGKELRMASRGRDGHVYEMKMRAGEQNYTARPARGRLPHAGAEVTVVRLHDETRKTLSGDRLDRYLSAELRDRLKARGVQLRILDRVGRKTLVVRPREFEGEPLPEPRRIPVPGFGDIAVELYYRVPRDAETLSVALCRDGTRVVGDLRQIEGFDAPPWSMNRLEGVIDFPRISVAPGTRQGAVRDDAFEAFARAIRVTAPMLEEFIRKREAAEAERASASILKDIRRALVEALRQLPEQDYHWFDVGRNGEEPKRETEPGGPREAAPLERPGPLHTVRVHPAHATLAPNAMRAFTARAADSHGKRIESGVEFRWRIAEGPARILEHHEARAVVTALAAGTSAELEVTATQGERTVSARALLYLEESEPAAAAEGEGQDGLPGYRLLHAPGQPWRSRFVVRDNAIEVNSAHRDYAAARERVKTLRRYIGKLYAKEVVLLNFPEAPAAGAMERMIELLTRMDERL